MRKIKFRAWDKINKQWIDPELLSTNSSGEVVTIIDNNENHYSINDSCELQQFTGLKDKNGKEIYEGDIVKSNDIESSDIGLVVFKDGCFLQEIDDERWFINTKVFKYEVIGNIYENKDLIK